VRGKTVGPMSARSRRIRELVLVVAVVAALTAGWPLINLAVSARQPVPAGRTMSVGPNTAQSARFTVGRGWSVQTSATDPRQEYFLRHGAEQMSLMYVTLASPAEAVHLWAGLRKIVRLGNSSARLGKPTLITSARGRKGLTGLLTEDGRRGRATIYPAPRGNFAIEMISVGPQGASPAGLAAALRVALSVMFPAAAR
jgi:hypothetical protein